MPRCAELRAAHEEPRGIEAVEREVERDLAAEVLLYVLDGRRDAEERRAPNLLEGRRAVERRGG